MELAGYDVPPVRTERRSVSHARVLAGTEKRDARAVFRGLVVLAAHRLRRMGLAARVLEGWADETAFRVKVSPPSASEQTLLRVAALAWDGRVRPGPKGKVAQIPFSISRTPGHSHTLSIRSLMVRLVCSARSPSQCWGIGRDSAVKGRLGKRPGPAWKVG